MKRFVFFTLLLLALIGCQSKQSSNASSNTSESLTVSAAVSLKDVFNEIGNLYTSKTGRKVDFNFGASGTLQKQIETGAPVDVFASAGETQMDALVTGHLVDSASRSDFARNKLVLIVPKESRADLTEFSQLDRPEVQKIAVGNPKTVPAGQYTEQVFQKLNLSEKLQPKLVLAEDVRQVLEYVVRGETDAGIVYETDAKIAGDKVRIAASANEDLHAPILYPIAVIADGKQKQASQEFIDLVLSPDGQDILRKYGFSSPH